MHWYRSKQETGSISIRGETEGVVLSFQVRRGGEDWRALSDTVALEWTPCNYGGKRPWFKCPGVVRGAPCNQRVAVLYDGGDYFLCRHCYDLAYQSQRHDPGNRALTKTQNIRRKLGGTANMMEPFPDKPNRMHWRTYERLAGEAERAETIYEAAMWAHIRKMDEWIGKRYGEQTKAKARERE
jgi:hypothetical protein